MWLNFAPTSKDARMFQYVIPIVPNVKGQVIEVPVKPLKLLKKDAVLYRIDPTPFQFSVDKLKASLDQARAQKQLAEIEVKRNTGLVKASAGSQAQLDKWNAELAVAEASIASLKAQLDNATWQLEETVVRAPADGHVVNLQLRPGNMVSNMPVAAAMSFVSDESRIILASFSQSASRYIQVEDKAEIVFTSRPGQVYSGKITYIIKDTGEAQLTASGNIPVMTGTPITCRRLVRMQLDDTHIAEEIGQGAGGMIAVYTSKGKPVHMISKVVMRIQAWTGYLTSP